MAHQREMAKRKTHQSGIRLSGKAQRKSSRMIQSHLLFVLTLLIAGAFFTLHGRAANAQQNSGGAPLQLAKQSAQTPKMFSSLSATVSRPAGTKARLAVVPRRPQTPTGPPNAPVLSAPSSGATGVSTSPTLDTTVSDPAGSHLTVTFYGRVANTVGPDFTVVVLPDTQYYSSSLNGGTPAMFDAQTQWIVNNQKSLNIAYVAHLGDLVQNGDNGGNTSEWTVADGAMKNLESANIPYGVHPGNHDEGSTGSDDGDISYTVLYNQYFGVSRFTGRPYYGGNYGANNNNHYDLFSAGGMNFIVFYFAYDYNSDGSTGSDLPTVLAWANGVLQQYSDRHAILVSHYMMGNGNPANLSVQGGQITNTLGVNPNVFLTLAGHYNTLPGEGQRTSVVSGNTVQGLMSDYQDQPNGGNGWLRIMTFSPANNQISVQTYSPVLNQYMTDAGSQFTVPWNMPNSGYTNLGSVSNVASGSQATVNWSNLTSGVQYQWYAVVSNGTYTTTGPTWSFTTGTSSAPAVSLSATSLPFGSQIVNTSSAAQSVTLSNTGSGTLNISSIGASKDYSQTNTCGSSLGANGTCSVSVTFKPTVTGTDNGTLTISDNAGSGSQTVSLTGSGVASAPIASLSTTGLSFGSQVVNTSSTSQKVTLTNTGTASLSISSVAASGDYSATTCPSSLGLNAVCTINVTFTPTATGTRTGTVTITDNASPATQTVTLTGTGTTGTTTPAVSLSPTSLSFGYQMIGATSSAKSVTLTNSGTATLNISSIVASASYVVTNNCNGSVTAGNKCTIQVSFKPTAWGTKTGTVSITDNATGSPQLISLTGYGW